MDSGDRKKIRVTVAGLRQALERELDGAAAWRWAMRLSLEVCMTARGVAGEGLDFFAAGGKREPLVAGYCRELLAGCGPLLAAPAALGWLHQFWFDGERADLAAARSDDYVKVGAARVVPATQVYSEPYMVDFLLANSLGALWCEMHPASPLAARWRYLVSPAGRLTGPAMPATEITVCDPACGAGHFLLAAFDMLYDMFREEVGGEPTSVCAAVLNNALFGSDIDGRAVAVARASLWLRAAEKAPGLAVDKLPGLWANIVAAGGELGSLAAADEAAGPLAVLLSRRYTVVAANPPYLDKRDYAKSLRAYLRKHYPAGAGNLYAAFILRCLGLSDRYVAMVTPQTFLFIRSYAALRQEVFEQARICTMAHLGLGAFSDAVVDAALFVMAKGADEAAPGVYFKLLAAPDKQAALSETVSGYNAGEARPEVFVRTLAAAAALPARPLAYWLGDGLRSILAGSPPLSAAADVVLGMKTADNTRFVRRWWEMVDPEETGDWAPYEKEASGYRYARPSAHRVRWTPVAQAYYRDHYSAQLPNPRYWFREGIVFGLISSKAFTAKLLPAGHMTDMAASCVFPRDGRDTGYILGLLNSKIYQWLLKMFNPTVNFQPVDVQRLPLPALSAADQEAIGRLALTAAVVSGELRAAEITDRGYRFNPGDYLPLAAKLPRRLLSLWLAALRCQLAADAIDRRLTAVLGLSATEAAAVAAELGGSPGDLPALAGYDLLPDGLTGDGLPPPAKVVSCSPDELAAYKNRLRLRYQAGPDRGRTPEEFFGALVADIGLHPITVYEFLREGVECQGWRCPPLERELAVDFASATVLAVLGHAWPGQEAIAAPGLLPLAEVRRELDRLFGRWADPASVAVDFATLTGLTLDRWLEQDFFKHHAAQFKRRPVVWHLAGGSGAARLVHRRRAGDIAALYGLDCYAPHPDYGVRVNIAPLQAAGLLAAPVLAAHDLGRALADYGRCVAGEYML